MKLHVLPPSANSHGCIAVVKDLGMDIEVRDTAEFAGGISHGPYLFSRVVMWNIGAGIEGLSIFDAHTSAA